MLLYRSGGQSAQRSRYSSLAGGWRIAAIGSSVPFPGVDVAGEAPWTTTG